MRGRGLAAAVLGALLLVLTGCTGPAAPTPAGSTPAGSTPAVGPDTGPAPAVGVVASGLAAPWGIAFLPDGAALVTERDSARIIRVDADGVVREVQRVADVVPGGEGGLLGIAVGPSYRSDGLVYVYYTSATDNRIARLRLGGTPQPILTGIPKAAIHDGGRIVFGPDGYLYAGTGDAADGSRAQDLRSLGGKILRITPDGRPAPGNPFPGSPVYSLGHRNVQGLAFDPAGRLYASELGASAYDELNRIVAGGNYGWPVVEGRATGAAAGRFVQPLVTWPTDEASPSGIAIAGGYVYVASLRGERLWQVPLSGRGATGTPRSMLTGYGRLRAVTVAPGGALWVLTTNRDGRGSPRPGDDHILTVRPAGP